MAMSYEEIARAIEAAARDQGVFGNAESLYVEGTYPDGTVVVCIYPKPDGMNAFPPPEFWQLAYSVDDEGKVSFTGEPVRVTKETGWVAFAHRAPGVEMRFADFGSYTWEKIGDTYAIRRLPVFKLGFHQGFPFDEEWADLTISEHAKFQDEDGWRPAVIKGHNTKGGDEKPAFALMRNLRRDGVVMYADLEGLDAPTFEEIQKGRWPYRSVEVRPEEHRFTALALLGGTPPYHKFPPLAFDAREGAMWFSLSPGSMEVIQMDPKKGNGGGGTGGNGDAGGTGGAPRVYTREELDAAIEAARTDSEKHFSEERAEDKKQLQRVVEDNRQSAMREFTRKLEGLGLAPGIVDADEVKVFVETFSRSAEVMTFAEGGEVAGLAALGRLVTLFAEAAKKNALFGPELGMRAAVEGAEHSDDMVPQPVKQTPEETKRFGENVDPDTLLEVRFTDRVAAVKNISFDAASSLVRGGEIDEAGLKALEAQKK